MLLREIIDNELASHLTFPDIHAFSLTSKSFLALFDSSNQTLWNNLIVRDFKMSHETLVDFKNEVAYLFPKKLIDARSLYRNLYKLSKRYKPDYFAENILHSSRHLVLLAYCTCDGEIAKRFVPKEELKFYEEMILHLDSPSLFTHLAEEMPTNKKVCYFSTIGPYAREYGWDEKKVAGGYIPNYAVHGNDLSEWLRDYKIFHLTSFFIDPESEYGLARYPSVEILRHGSLENVKQLFKLDKDFKDKSGVIEYLASNPNIPADYIYPFLQQVLVNKTQLSVNFLSDLLTIGRRNEETCYQIIQFIKDNKMQLSNKLNTLTCLKIIKLGFGDELAQLEYANLLNVERGLYKAYSELQTTTAREPDLTYLQNKPIPFHLKKAIMTNNFSAIQSLVEKGMTLTNEMLKIAISVRTRNEIYYGPSENLYFPDPIILDYILQPKFGLTLTQHHFVEVINNLPDLINIDLAVFKDAITYLIEGPPKLILTQDIMEKIYLKRGFFVSGYLTKPGFEYLRPTIEMLNTAFNRKNINEVKFLLREEFGLDIKDCDYGIVAAKCKQYDLVEFLFQPRFNTVPTQKMIAHLIAFNQLTLAKKLVDDCQFIFNEDFLEDIFQIFKKENSYYSDIGSFDSYHASLHRFAFGLELMKDQGICFSSDTLQSLSISYHDMSFIRMLLEYQYRFTRENVIGKCGNVYSHSDSDIQLPFLAEKKIRKVLELLKEGKDISLLMKESYQTSPRQCMLVLMHIVTHPEIYKLQERQVNSLVEAMSKLTLEISVVEKKQIQVYVRDAIKQLENVKIREELEALHFITDATEPRQLCRAAMK